MILSAFILKGKRKKQRSESVLIPTPIASHLFFFSNLSLKCLYVKKMPPRYLHTLCNISAFRLTFLTALFTKKQSGGGSLFQTRNKSSAHTDISRHAHTQDSRYNSAHSWSCLLYFFGCSLCVRFSHTGKLRCKDVCGLQADFCIFLSNVVRLTKTAHKFIMNTFKHISYVSFLWSTCKNMHTYRSREWP